MAKTSMSQRKTMGRVMHEYTHGELKSGPQRQRRQGEEPPSGDRYRAQGGRRLQVRERQREQARNLRKSKQKEAARPDLASRSARARRGLAHAASARSRGRWAVAMPRPRPDVAPPPAAAPPDE